MKNNQIHKPLRSVLVGLALASSVSLAQAQGVDDYIVQRYTNDIGTWAYNYGSAVCTTVWDGTENRNAGDGTGSMKVTIPFDLCSGLVQTDFEGLFGETLDLTKYTTLHLSVKVDPSSSRLGQWGNGAMGNMRAHIRTSSWGGDGNFTTPDSAWVNANYGTWVDYALPIDPTKNVATQPVAGILGFDIWSGWGNCTDFPTNTLGHTNTVILWVDNIWFEWNTNQVIPPPTLSIKKPGANGVTITLAEAGNQWQRDALVTPSGAGNYFWGGNGATPVTYSFTISDFPNPIVHEGFQAHMFLINADTGGSDTGFNATYGGADWNVPDIVRVMLTSTTNGTYDLAFNWKTNLANNNPPAGALNNPATVTNIPSPLGTWSVSFTHNTNVTMSGPGGVLTNFTIPEAAVLNNFSPASSVIQFGFHKNDNENDGHNDGTSGTYTRVQKTGGAVVFDDTFNAATLTNNYAWRVTSATAVQHIPPGTAWQLGWTLPALGFAPQSAATASGPWGNAGASTIYQSGPSMNALIPSAALPAGNSGLFRLIKRSFTKLQVLLPGETAAPGTPSGKTGTPTAQDTFNTFFVTVRAVDDDWNLIPGIVDSIQITSSDGSALLPAAAPMANGTVQFEVLMATPGPQTITATNITDGTKLPNTSSSFTVN